MRNATPTTSQPLQAPCSCNNRWSPWQKLALGSLLLLMLALYYPALSLPPSVIDDHVIRANSENLVKNWQQHGFIHALKNDVSIQQRTFNTGYWLLSAFQNRIFGGQPFHWFRLLELATVISLMFVLIRKASNNAPIVAGGLLAGVLLLVGEVPGGMDFHALRANWFRLYASDATALPWVLLHIAGIWAFALNPGPSRWPWLAASALAFYAAFSIKIPMVIVLAPLGLVGILAFFLRMRRLALVFLVYAAVNAGVFLICNYLLRQIAPVADTTTYTSQYTVSYQSIKEGVLHYTRTYWQTLGPLLPVVVAMSLAVAFRLARKPSRIERLQALLLVYLLAGWVCFTMIYTPWPARLPRYMLTGYTCFCLLAGILTNMGIQSWRSQPIPLPRLLMYVAAGIVSALLPPVAALVIFCVVASAWACTGKSRFVVVSAGAAAVGVCYVLFAGYLGCRGLNRFYVAREFANWQALKILNAHAVEKRTIWFAGDRGDEHIGSLAGFMAGCGVNVPVIGIDQPLPATNRVVVVHHILSPAEWRTTPPGFKVTDEIRMPEPDLVVPFGYWQTRERLFKQEKPVFHQIWSYAFVWRFLE